MLKINIDLHPGGDSSRARTLATLKIANDLTGTPDLGNYTLKLTVGEEEKTSGVQGFPRKKRDAVDLLLWALLALRGKDNRDAIEALESGSLPRTKEERRKRLLELLREAQGRLSKSSGDSLSEWSLVSHITDLKGQLKALDEE